MSRGAALRGFRAVARSHVTKMPLALAVPATRRGCGGQRHPTRLGSAPPPLCPSRLIQLPSFSACVCPRPLCLHAYFLLKPSFLLLLIHSIEFQSFSKNYYFFLVKRCISSISLHSLLKPHRTTPKGLANNKITNNHHKKK